MSIVEQPRRVGRNGLGFHGADIDDAADTIFLEQDMVVPDITQAGLQRGLDVALLDEALF